MEVLEAIKSVKSVSKYKPDPIPEQKVQAVVNAARFALSADNLQPWKFILLEQASMAQRALTPGNAAYCSECGAETPPDAKSCARCGEPFEGSMQAVLCPICNSINPAAATECLNCNAKFPEAGLDE